MTIHSAERREDYRHLKATASILTIAVMVGGIIGGMASIMGFKWFGPAQQVQALSSHVTSLDSAMNVRVTRLEVAAIASGASIQALKDTVNLIKSEGQFNSYLLCVVVRKVEPSAVPGKCGH